MSKYSKLKNIQFMQIKCLYRLLYLFVEQRENKGLSCETIYNKMLSLWNGIRFYIYFEKQF